MRKGVIIECKDQYTYVFCSKGNMKKIKREYFHEVGQEIKLSNFSLPKVVSLVMVSCAIIIAVIFNPFQSTQQVQALSYISLSVNPGLVLKVDSQQNIVAVSYTNKDGETLTSKIDFINKSLDDSVRLFLDYCFDNNLFANNNKIDINVISDDQNQIKELEKKVQALVSNYLNEHQATVSIQIDKVTEIQQTQAKELGIPDSKMKLVDLVRKYYPQYTQEELARKSVDDLLDYLEDKGYDEDLLDKLEDDLEEQEEKNNTKNNQGKNENHNDDKDDDDDDKDDDNDNDDDDDDDDKDDEDDDDD